MKIRWLIFAIFIARESIANAEIVHQVELAGYLAEFSTSLGSSEKKVLSPLGVQLRYSFRTEMQMSFYGNYATLNSGKGTILQGLSGGIDYAILGGQSQTYTYPKNSAFFYYYAFRLGLCSGLTVRSYDLGSLEPGGVKFPLLKTVPNTGQMLGWEPGLSIEGALFGRIRYSAHASYVFPYFISNAEQKGHILSLSAGLGTQL